MSAHTGLLLATCTVAALLVTTQGFMCPTLFDFYPDPEDCSKFYRCFWGAGYQFDCPKGTLWNHKVLTCDFAYNVDCEDGHWGEEAYYVEQHLEDHTHDYRYDDGNGGAFPTRGSDGDDDAAGRWDSAGSPRDDSTHWGGHGHWVEERGESQSTGHGAGGSEPADSAGLPEYQTGTPGYARHPGSVAPRHQGGGHTDHARLHVRPRNVSDVSASTTAVPLDDRLLIDHLHKLGPPPDKRDRIGAIGSFQEQKTADRSRDTNVDYVYANDKDEKAKTHGRYGYYGFPGVQRSGYYAPPSQRIPFFWPFEKRK